MRRIAGSIMLIFSMVVSLISAGSILASESRAEEKKSDYIIMTDETGNSIQDIKAKYEGEYGSSLSETCSDYGEAYAENYMRCEMSRREAEELASNEDIIVEKDALIQACASGEEEKGESDPEWNIQMVRADDSHAETGEGKIKVAVLDSGVDDFNDVRLADSINLIPGEENVLPLFWDVTGHGSSVAGIIAAEKNDVGITGIAPEAEIYAAKVLDDKNQAPVSRVIDGIYWAIDKKVNIINMSFGIKSDSAALHRAIRDAYEAGILLVAAAGNDGAVEYPAAYDEVIAVGSVDTSGVASEESASGDEMELTAPGEQICSTGAFEGTLVSAGTSMAAPHVTGIAARLWAKDTSVTAEFIRQLMAASANQCGSADDYGYGLVDLAYAEEVYEDFKKEYTEGATLRRNAADIPSNENEVEEYESDYVEGRWKHQKHEEMIVNGSLSSSQISIVKTGAIYPDKEGSGLRGKDKNPQWHGNYDYKVQENKFILSNYIASYIYITRIAIALGKGKSASSAQVPADVLSVISSDTVSDVNSLPYSTILATPTAANKKLLLWGMAIHSATDVYAHSVYSYKDGVWKPIEHPAADDSTVYPKRCETAKNVAKASLKRLVAGREGSVSDFNPSNSYVNAGVKWKVKNLSTYAATFSSSVSNALKSYSI